jgi:hypothetical protein
MTTSSGMTRSKVCIKCGVDKLVDAYGNDSRTDDGFGRTCRECRGGKGKRSGGGKAVKAKTASSRVEKQEVAPEPVTITAALEVPAGYGFRASIEDSTLQLEQDRVDDDGTVYTHTISLSSAEAARIVDWIADQVKAA